MKAVNQKAKAVFDKLTAGMKNVGIHRKIENGAYMPLSIEVIDTYGRDEGLEISICHYGEQNGDLMRDPEMIFIYVGGQYYPYYYRNDYIAKEEYSAEFNPNGEGIQRYWKSLQRQHAVFAGQWAQNLKDQGFIEAMNKPSKEFKGSASDFLRENMGEELYKQATNSGLLIEEGDGSLRAPIKTPLQVGTAAYNFAKAEGLF